MSDHTDDLPEGWHVHNDAEDEPTLWFGATAVLRKLDVFRITGGKNDRAKQAFVFHLWDLLTAVHTPDEATVERLAMDLTRWNYPPDPFFVIRGRSTIEAEGADPYALIVKTVLAALAGTSAQARHTADDATGGGEHG